MTRSRTPKGLTFSEESARALASPHRLELITALGELGSASIADLAHQLGRSRHSLYYHVKLLETAGVLVPLGTRRRGRRDEQVWKLASDAILVGASPGGRGASSFRLINAMLRLTARELTTAIQQARPDNAPRTRELIGMRLKARVNRSTLQRINRLIDQITSLMRESSRKGKGARVFALTIVLNPVGGEERENGDGD